MKRREAFGRSVQMVPFLPGLRRITGSITAAIFLRQAIYWTGKQRDPDGWIFKRAGISEEDPRGLKNPENQSIEFETSLTYKEQFVARTALRARGFLSEKYDRSQHRMYFRVNLRAVGAAWERVNGVPLPDWLPVSSQDGISQKEAGTSQKEAGIIPKGVSLNGTSIEYTENTKEKTQGITKAGMPLTWSIGHGLPVSEEQLERERTGEQATSAVEAALGVRDWPWASTRAWEKMVSLVADAWKQDPDIFREYAEWMEGEGKYKAMSVKQIRANPQQFIDTGWPLFLASRRPREPEPVQGETDLMRRIREREAANGRGRKPPT